ncbi:GroES-like protein [Aaosphaeria arxii CBS 175.79]|uniref:GroES-like protein n=1 Tax=Aaosphaeria arxii CBS 175.79 TaxID=1450172 RepID=A0A6A5Y3Z8_9PLEO|nr:GroES-like protein [Aaosphaeria arxii CBS 175.79]KAF2020218.1 GroES-like protein [Aaosphaeria arxii CBS 175.79]
MVSWPFAKRRKSTFSASPLKVESVEEKTVKRDSVQEEDAHHYHRDTADVEIPEQQSALLLHAVRQPYEATSEYSIPKLEHDYELLVKVNAVGLNPIDWKSPDYGFGIPTLPFISGRELVGTVVQAPSAPNSRIKKGDVVIVPSTDYRDLRKAAFQEYTIASSFNTIRLPKHTSQESGSILGVAFVAAVLALGICMGVSFEDIENGPDLRKIVREIDPERLPEDIRQECLKGIEDEERAKSGDFLVIWGGSSTCAHTMKQIARAAGLKIISVVDTGKHGLRLSSTESIRPDLIVDSHDPERAIAVIRAATENSARFGFDTQGKDSAAQLLRSLASTDPKTALPNDIQDYEAVKTKLPTPPSTPSELSKTQRSHLVGLTGLPKTDIPDNTALHSIPIKLYHEIPEIGEALSEWCERLLLSKALLPPDVVGTVDGLDGINDGLDRLRKREIRGGRLVATLS